VDKQEIDKWATNARAFEDFLQEVANESDVSTQERADINRVIKRASWLIKRQAGDNRDLSHDRAESMALLRTLLQSLGGDPYGYDD
jgi:hypothetical protein